MARRPALSDLEALDWAYFSDYDRPAALMHAREPGAVALVDKGLRYDGRPVLRLYTASAELTKNVASLLGVHPRHASGRWVDLMGAPVIVALDLLK